VDELSRRLNAVYGALIDQVESYGGSIINFAGDSIIGWFEGAATASSPALRAMTCAQRMQAAMQEFQELSLKISITTGPARRFAVGDPRIQFLDALAGETISRLATGERLANRNEIIYDETTCRELGESVRAGAQRIDDATLERFSIFNSLVISAEKQLLAPLNAKDVSAEELRPWLLPMVWAREHTGLDTFLTELRPAVPVFVSFSGIDYDHDEEAEEKLNAFVSHAQSIISRYEGSLLQLVIGDKGSYVYAVFGAPTAHEDDAQRAVYASLELKQPPHQLRFIQTVQIGISLGTLRVGAYGSSTRRTYAALGDDVNLAARLMTTAESGEILISGRVQVDVADVFTLEPREPIRMKGKGEPQSVFAVTGISHHRASRLPEPAYRLPMIGRQDELALVDEKLNLALQGKGQIIGITADAGMGKSRLVAEVIRLARKRGFVGYGGACQSSGTNTPYLVWQSIWQAFFDLDVEMPQRKQIRLLEGEIEDRAPERVDSLPLLGLVLDLPQADNDFTKALEPKDRKIALEALLEDCLKSAALETPLLIVLEDLHWVDPLSNELLETLARMSETLPICFVLAYRPPDAVRYQSPRMEGFSYFTKIELKTLTASDSEQLIRAKLAQLFPERTGPLPKTLVSELTTKSQGNPFFIEELLNYLHDRGLNPYDATTVEALDLPTSLQTLILSRVDQLTEPQKATLKVASVIGRVFPFSWLRGYYPSLGEDQVIKSNLSELSKLDLTPLDTPEPELAYLFKHIITQEVAYESLAYATRAQLHELLARYLETTYPNDLPVESLAFHYSRSDNLNKKREYYIKSGNAAQAAYSNATAIKYYEQALDLSRDGDEIIDLHLQTGTVLQWIGSWDEARTHFQKALQTAEESKLMQRIIECEIKLGAWCNFRGNYSQAQEWLEKALVESKRINDLAKTCDALGELGIAHWRLANFEAAREYLQQSIDLGRQMGDKKRVAYALTVLGYIGGQMGNPSEGHQYFEEALAIGRELNDKRRIAAVLTNYGTMFYFEGHYEKSQKLLEEALAATRELGDKRAMAITLNNLGNIFYLKNDFNSAREYYGESLALGRESDDKYTKSLALASLGITAFRQGRFPEAVLCYEEGLRLNRELDDKLGLSLTLCYLGLLALAQDQLKAARESFMEGLTVAHQSDIKPYVVYNLIGMAGVVLAEGCPSRGAILLAAAKTIAESIGFKIEPELQEPYDKTFSTIRESLSESEFQDKWDEGKNMDVKRAVQVASE
jgi:predicted ATPase/class 3 adenylate cyclase